MKDHSANYEIQRPAIYENRLWRCLSILWLLTLAASFEDGALLKIRIPGIGALYGFRILLAVSAVLFAIWGIRYRVHLWRDASVLERWAYVFAAVMILCGALSLPRAISFEESLRTLLNLIIDILFFCIALQAFHDGVLRRRMIAVCGACLLVVLLLGQYEVLFGGLVNKMYDGVLIYPWWGRIYQSPVVFSQNTNDYASAAVFVYTVLVVCGLLWRCDTRKNLILTALVTALLFFLNQAAGARLCFFAFCLFLAGTALSAVLKKGDRKRALLCLALVLILIGFILIGQSPLINKNLPARGSLTDEFFEIDAQTGQRVLRQYDSAGVRARLLLHCFDCIFESRGLGVGLGNTARLAELRAVAVMRNGLPYGSVHCFIARVLADYGIFAAVPMAAIGLLLLRAAFLAFRSAVRRRDREGFGRAVLFLFMLLTYPILSSAPSDAQDIIPMWLFLAAAVFEADRLSAAAAEDKTQKA